jgi:putative endonuclease
MAETGPFFVYILRCSDGSLYVGHSANISDRVAAHNAGRGAAWTARRMPVVLAFTEWCASEEDAVRRERQIKRWTHAKKEALIEGNLTRLKELSKSK